MDGAPTDAAELFDADSSTFSSLPPMTSQRDGHTATLLPSGKVLIAGGWRSGTNLSTAELFDPNSGTFESLSHTMTTERNGHTATLLANGKVLIAGGDAGAAAIITNTAEIFDPITEIFSPLPNVMMITRFQPTATLLPNGKVLIAGGYDGSGNTGYSDKAELFDPASGNFTALPSMSSRRYSHTATLLPSGKVLIAGGISVVLTPPTNSAELFDPVLETFTSLLPNTMTGGRENHTATLLPNGQVLIAGGFFPTSGYLNTAEVFDAGLSFSDARRPVIASATDPLLMPASLVLSGNGFRGDSQADGGSPQSSATNYPIVQLMRIDNDQVFFPLSDPATNWSDTTFSSETLGTTSTLLPVGQYRVTVFTNATPSVQKIIDIEGSTTPQVPLTNVVSRKAHGDVAVFDIPLPLSENPGIECRSGGANGNYTIIFTFANNLISVDDASVSSGIGTVNSRGMGSDTHQYIVSLTGVANAQIITVSLNNVRDSVGNFSSVVSTPMGVLLGDTTADGSVNSADISQTKSQSGHAVSSSNFREDVTVDGSINSSDISLVKSKSGTALPILP